MNRKTVRSCWISLTTLIQPRRFFCVSSCLSVLLYGIHAGPPPAAPPASYPMADGATLTTLTIQPAANELIFSEGETAILSCRGNLNWSISWWKETDGKRTNMSTRGSAISSVDEADGRYVTLNLTLTIEDAGLYTCQVFNQTGVAILTSKAVRLDVMSAEDHCGFESGSLCSHWTDDDADWFVRKSAEEDEPFQAICLDHRAHYDNTYGPKNSVGHYLQASFAPPADLAAAATTAVQSNLTSPMHNSHGTSELCLRFYSLLSGSDRVRLSVLIKTSSELVTLREFQFRNVSDWTLQSVNISANSTFQIVFSASGSCNDTVAIDDVTLENSTCFQATGPTPLPALTNRASTSTNVPSSTTKLASPSSPSVASPTASAKSIVTPTTASTLTVPATVKTVANTMPSSTLPRNSNTVLTTPFTSKNTSTILQTSSSISSETVELDDIEGEGRDNEQSSDSVITDSGAGLAIGIILAIMAAAACTAGILYRRSKKGKKSAYITFGNPSYSREHLPANDFSLESPLTLSSNGYTVLA